MAQIVGVFRLGRDAEVRFTTSGKAVASLAMAFNYGRKEDDGSRPSQWVEASLWEKRAEAMAPYLKKGGLVYCVINDPHIESYQKSDGTAGVKLVGSIGEIEFAGGSPGKQEQAPAKKPEPAPKPKANNDGFFDDEPF